MDVPFPDCFFKQSAIPAILYCFDPNQKNNLVEKIKINNLLLNNWLKTVIKMIAWLKKLGLFKTVLFKMVHTTHTLEAVKSLGI